MSGEIDLAPVAALYEANLAKHGPTSAAVGWRDSDQHRLRFAKLATVIEPADGAVRINDLGCGYGAFLPFLRESAIAVRHFRGYDVSQEMVQRAREEVHDGEFIAAASLTEMADFSFACGIFNVKLAVSDQEWLGHVDRTLQNLFEFSSRGFAFNLLSSYVDYRESHLYYGDPLRFFHLCKTQFGRRVALLHDYPLYEWTITVRKS
jgi:SAM-dependent methyltransferase